MSFVIAPSVGAGLLVVLFVAAIGLLVDADDLARGWSNPAHGCRIWGVGKANCWLFSSSSGWGGRKTASYVETMVTNAFENGVTLAGERGSA